MRLKFEKGMTPEAMARMFVKFVRENDLIIGAVNMYIQTYNDEMVPEKFDNEEDFFVCKPSDTARMEYENDVANIRRKRIRVVNE